MASTEDQIPTEGLAEAPIAVEAPMTDQDGAEQSLSTTIEPVPEDMVTSPARSQSSSTGVKRPVVAGAPKRLGTSNTTTTTTRTAKPMASTTSRSAAGSTLNKPPIRPSATSASRKLPGSTISGTVTTTRTSRMSISSSADERARAVASSGDESRKSGMSGTAKRTSLTGTIGSRTTRPTPSTTDRRSSLTPSADKKPVTSRPSTATSTPTKTGLRSTPTSTTTTPRTSRTSPPSAKAPAISDATRKRTGLSASPAPSRRPPGAQAIDESAENDKITELETRLASTEEKLLEAQAKIVELEKSHGESSKLEETAQVYTQEIGDLQGKLEELESKYHETLEQSKRDLERVQQEATDLGETKNTEALALQRSQHDTAVKHLETELAAKENSITELASKVDVLIKELDEAGKRLEESKGAEKENAAALKQKLDLLNQELSSSRKELESTLELSAQNTSTFEEKVTSLEKQLQELRLESEKGSAGTAETLLVKDKEIQKLNAALEELKADMQRAHQSRVAELEQLKVENDSSRDLSLANLKADHDRALAKMIAGHDVAVAQLTAQYNTERTEAEAASNTAKSALAEELNKKIQELTTEISALNGQMESSKSTHTTDVDNLKAKLLESGEALAREKVKAEKSSAEVTAAMVEIDPLKTKVQSLEATVSEQEATIKSLTASLEGEKAQVTELQKVIEALETDSKHKDEHHENENKKLSAEIKGIQESISGKEEEITSMKAQHAAELKALEAAHSADISKQKSETAALKEKHQTLQGEHDELRRLKAQTEEANRGKLEALAAAHAQQVEEHNTKFASLSETYKASEGLTKELQDSHTKLKADFENTLAETKKSLESSHSKGIEELLFAHNIKLNNLRQEYVISSAAECSIVEKKHAEAVAILQAELKKATEAAADTSAIDSLKAQMDELKQSHSSKLQSTNDEKAELQAKLDSQSTASKDANAAREELMATHAGEVKTIREEIAKHSDAHAAAMSEIKALKEAAVETESHCHEAEKRYSELEANMAALSEKNMEMVVKIQEYEASASKAARKIRDLEFDLKDAQKTETPTSNGANKGHAGLGASKWATTETTELPETEAADGKLESSGPLATEGEKLSSSIAGTMASIQEQLRQLEGVNDEMLEDRARIINVLEQTTSRMKSGTNSPPVPSLDNPVSSTLK